MLTRFFGTTKPSAIIVILVYMTIGFFYSNRLAFTTTTEIFKVIAMWLLFIFAMFILNFISQKNELTKRNAYRILLFAAFGLALPTALQDLSILLAGVCILVSLRRIISLRSGLHLERKIFDAAFWICLASLVYFYSWHYMLAIYLGILIYKHINIRYFLIPILAVFCFFILAFSVVLALKNGTEFLATYPEAISFNFSAYNQPQVLIAIAFLLGVLLWTIWSYLGELKRASSTGRDRYSVILAILLVGLTFVLLTPHKTGGEWYFVIPIIAIIVSHYLDTTESVFFKESLLWLIVILPIVINIL